MAKAKTPKPSPRANTGAAPKPQEPVPSQIEAGDERVVLLIPMDFIDNYLFAYLGKQPYGEVTGLINAIARFPKQTVKAGKKEP